MSTIYPVIVATTLMSLNENNEVFMKINTRTSQSNLSKASVCLKFSSVSHPEHDAMFDVEQNLFLLSVVSDEGMQGVTVGHPANQAGVGGQGDHSVTLNTDDQTQTQTQKNTHLLVKMYRTTPSDSEKSLENVVQSGKFIVIL